MISYVIPRWEGAIRGKLAWLEEAERGFEVEAEGGTSR